MRRDVHARELAYHEEIYAGFAQRHFARPAVRAFRRHSAERIMRALGAGPGSRLLSIGCGIGDTELLLAPRVKEMVGLDLSPTAIRQARADARRLGVTNVRFEEGSLEEAALEAGAFDGVFAIFLLHHLPDGELDRFPSAVARLLAPGGGFYSLDPSRYRLTGAVGRLLIPRLMEKHQSPDERELAPAKVRELFARTGFEAEHRAYDFLSTPLAGLFPSAAWLYRTARLVDEVLIRAPLVNRAGSNFEVVARRR